MIEALTHLEKSKLVIASGETHPDLATDIAREMGMDLCAIELREHPDTEPYVRIDESVRGKHVLAIQSHGASSEKSKNDSFLQHLGIIDAARLSKASTITAISPNLIGSRGDRQVLPRESVPAHLYLRMLGLAGASSLVTVDLHSPATLGAFYGSVDHLSAQPLLRAKLAQKIRGDKEQYVVISPDVGHSKEALRNAQALGIDMISLDKSRDPRDSTSISHASKVDGVNDRVCLMMDDLIDTAGTLHSAALTLKNSGAKAVYAAATHGWFSRPGPERLEDSFIDEIIVTDTLPTRYAKDILGDRLQVVSVAKMMATALVQIVTEGSVEEMTKQGTYP